MTQDEEMMQLLRTVIEAPLGKLVDSEFLGSLLQGGGATGFQMACVSRALDARLIREMDRLGLQIDKSIRSADETSTKLQNAANRLSRRMLWCTLVILIVTGVQAYLTYRS